MKKLLNWLKWIDDNILKILVFFFIFFIPLYPKIPLFRVDYSYIYIRIEDMFLVLLTFIFFIQVLRRKVVLDRKFFILMSIFWIAVFISFLHGFYQLKTIQVPHIGFLHSARRIEYMIIFLIVLPLIKSKKDFFNFFYALMITLAIVDVYGIGQKFFGWPAVQTMNPEYAKGYLLYLTPEARISSTFAGHYDLASFLIFFIPMVIGLFLLKNKLIYYILFFISLTGLVFTASRVSYIGYIVSVFSLLILVKKPKLFASILVLTIILTLLSQNLTSRLKRTFQVKRILVDQRTGAVYVPQKITTKELPAGSLYVVLNNQTQTGNATASDAAIKQDVVKKQRIEMAKKGQLNEKYLATLSANLRPINTVVTDISVATRLQVEWPRAWQAFIKQPLLGTGPSSITEATDNDYLRWLGETGLLGTITFLIILFTIVMTINPIARIRYIKSNYLYWGYFFGFFALLINASYIDVFEASKVAYIFWLVSGMFVGLTRLKQS